MSDAKYMSWVKLLNEVEDQKKEIITKTNSMQDAAEELTGDMYPTHVSDHCLTQTSNRLEELTHKSRAAYDDIHSRPHKESLFMISNLKCFILTMASKAIEDGSYKKRRSKSGGAEYVYSISISKWKTDKELIFTIIVENSVAKTAYFNLVGK